MLKMNQKDSKDIPFDNENDLRWNLNHRLNSYGDALVVKTKLDVSGGNISDSDTTTEVYGYNYDITFRKNRGTT